MLTVLIGNDYAKRVKRLDAILVSAEKKGDDVQIFTDVHFDPTLFRTIAESMSLFGGTSTVVLSGVSDVTELRESLEKILPILSESPHTFIISEIHFLAPFLKKVQSSGGVIEKFELAEKVKKEEAFNSFLLTDAFSERKRSVAWPLYRKAIDLGVEPRELAGKIFWATKNMLIAKKTSGAGESGLNPFVYSKAKLGSKNFSDAELEKIASDLTTLFHESMLSSVAFEPALEACILRALAK
jgi:DNA polymerase III delta subunit